jgi:hypothetical protein
MALSISQILSASYEAVLNEKRKPANQWADSSFMKELERQGALKKVGMGPTIEHTIDYQRNQGGEFLATDLTALSMSKTEVLSALSFTPGEVVVPMVWSKGDEVKNPSENQKIAFVASLIDNGLQTHDDLIEEALFETSTNGFLGLQTLVPDSGQGTVGGVSAALEAWHRNPTGTYLAAGTNILASLTAEWNSAAKGSGGATPSLLISGADAQAIYEGALTANQRFVDTNEASGGFKVLAFKTARWVFSQHGGTRIYLLNPKAFRVNVAKNAFRDKTETQMLPNQMGFEQRIYTMLQATVSVKSRNAVLTQN